MLIKVSQSVTNSPRRRWSTIAHVQMNPHSITESLNSINAIFIVKKIVKAEMVYL